MTQPGPPAASPVPADYYGEIESGAAAIGALVAGGALALPIPSCPEWTLRELAIHVGRAHRWSAQITATRSRTFVEFRSVPDGKFPGDAAAQARWLAAGARRAVAAFEEAGQDPVWWAFGPLAPASFWARRMGHETLVHAADAALAAGQPPDLPPALAADAIDEWLTVLMPAQARPADPRERALPPGAALHVHAAGAGGWVIRREPAGVTVTRTAGREPGEPGGPGAGEPAGPVEADAVLAGPAGPVLLVLMGRVPPGDPAVTVSGDRALLDGWLAAAQF
jgi:uncharacterized protein (TIGR03083 family)